MQFARINVARSKSEEPFSVTLKSSSLILSLTLEPWMPFVLCVLDFRLSLCKLVLT